MLRQIKTAWQYVIEESTRCLLICCEYERSSSRMFFDSTETAGWYEDIGQAPSTSLPADVIAMVKADQRIRANL